MSDSGMDISKLVGLIMQNPEIIEKIRSLAEHEGSAETAEALAEVDTGASSEQIEDKTEAAFAPEETVAAQAASHRSSSRHRRELLCALKPYLSKKRADAIDTALGIMEVIAVMKG